MSRYREAAGELASWHARRPRRRAVWGAVATSMVVMLLGLWGMFRGEVPAQVDGKVSESTAAQSGSPSMASGVSARGRAAPVTLPGAESSLSTVPQQLKLVSTSPGRTPREGSAQLGTHPENPQTYVAGALLVNGARLAEVYPEYVVLERDGQRSRLYLAGVGKALPTALSMVGGVPARSLAVGTYEDVLTRYVRPSPVFDGDRLKGYQVYPGPRSAAFAQLGLQGGDVILALDGQPFGDSHQAAESLRQLTTGLAMVATIERRGKIEQVSLDGRVVLADQQNEQAQSVAPPALAGM